MMLKHLETIGLIVFEHGNEGWFGQVKQPSEITVVYYGAQVNIKFKKEKNDFITGQVVFTNAGEELASVCNPGPREGFKDYVLKQWRKLGYKVSEIT